MENRPNGLNQVGKDGTTTPADPELSAGGSLRGPERLFERRHSSLRAGVALDVSRFLVANSGEIVQRLRTFVSEVSLRPRSPSDAEVASWTTSIPALQRLLDDQRFRGLWVLLEVALPHQPGRIDCVLIGSDSTGRDRIIILELKAWSAAKRSPSSSTMLTPIVRGRAFGKFVHPSVQCLGYRTHMKELLAACHDEARVGISAVAWLYNAKTCATPPFSDVVFSEALQSAPAFGGSQVADLRAHLWSIAPCPPNSAFLRALDESNVVVPPALMERLSDNIVDYVGFSLSDDQIEAFHRIINAYDPNERRVVVVRGGPGAGKSVLALQLLCRFHKSGIPALYFACSRAILDAYQIAFHESRSVFAPVGAWRRGNGAVQIIDEAHRLRDEQVRPAIESARLSVFLIDDVQIIVPGDIEGHRKITRTAASVGPRDALVLDLSGDKRSGSEGYVYWVNEALQILTAPRSDVPPPYRFQIVDSPHDLEARLRECDGMWRIVAGLCWPRTDTSESGEVANDIVIDEFGYRRAWAPDASGVEDTPLHRAALCWATEPAAQRFIGNVYTAQSFEFDYVGVIFGRDLVVRGGKWQPELAHHPKSDRQFYINGAYARPGRAATCLKNAYRVLLTRGRRGCFVFFQDPETRRHFERLLGLTQPD
jgi:hypothetical protein